MQWVCVCAGNDSQHLHWYEKETTDIRVESHAEQYFQKYCDSETE